MEQHDTRRTGASTQQHSITVNAEMEENVLKLKDLLYQVFSYSPDAYKKELEKNSTLVDNQKLKSKLYLDFLECQKDAESLYCFTSFQFYSRTVNVVELNSRLQRVLHYLQNIATVDFSDSDSITSIGYLILFHIKTGAEGLRTALLTIKPIKKCKTFKVREEIAARNAREALDHYLSTGSKIRLNASTFKNSPLGLLERILVNKEAECLKYFRSISPRLPFFTETSFFALAAPSLEGKTQSAFVLEAVKPLYFPLSKAVPSSHRASQFIYNNYSGLAVALSNVAQADEVYLKDLARQRGIDFSDANGARITDASSLEKFSNAPLWTLGFLVGLLEYLNQKFAAHPDKPWMELLADEMEFGYTQYSIEEIRGLGCFDGTCVFLDEFVAEPWALLVRNLCRLLNVNCVVANTNAQVANLVGKESTSVGSGDHVWSIVFNKLNWSTFSHNNILLDCKGPYGNHR